MFRQLAEHAPGDVVICTEHGERLYSHITTLSEDYTDHYIDKILQQKTFVEGTIHRFDQKDKILIRQARLRVDGKSLYAFYFMKKELPISISKSGMTVYNRGEAAAAYLLHYDEAVAHWREPGLELSQIASSRYPVMLMGEKGVGKLQMAASIYAERHQEDLQYCVIDCPEISDKMWNFLLRSEDSPMNESGWSLHFREVQTLSEGRMNQLISMVEDTIDFTHNQFIFSATIRPDEKLLPTVATLRDQLNCVVLHILPLRERMNELEQLTAIYLNTYNMEFVKQVSGFTEEARQSMKNYGWPGNLIQFKHVMKQLVQTTDTPYIQKEAVDALLNEEKKAHPETTLELDLTRTLEEINCEIARAVMDKVGNQTKAAKQLGICRTTLWRMLNRTFD